MSSKDDYERFKQDYPAVYDRLLEINRALGALHRRGATNVPPAQQENNAFITSGKNDSPFLELD